MKGTLIQEVGKPFTNLYLLYKNGVLVSNPFLGLNITKLPVESFFGDYQILIGSLATFDYKADTFEDDGHVSKEARSSENTWCMTLTAKKFLSLCD